jgi:hypothetical protein
MRFRAIFATTAAVLAGGAGLIACGGSSSNSSTQATTTPGAATSSQSSGGAAVAPSQQTAPADTSTPGDIPDNQAYIPYKPAGGGFSVKVPEGWSRTGAGASTTFTDKLNSIKIDSSAASSPVTVAQAKSTIVPQLAKTVPGYKPGTVSAVTRKAGQGVLITFTASTKPNPVTGKSSQDAVEQYIFVNNGKQVTLTLSGPIGADNVDPWRIVTDSLVFG